MADKLPWYKRFGYATMEFIGQMLAGKNVK